MGQEKPKEAVFYQKLEAGVRCIACNRYCFLKDLEVGVCGARGNLSGKLIAFNYGRNLTSAVDPVEKKPLFHFRPGSTCFSISTFGCNFKCLFCQNWDISQARGAERMQSVPFTSPEEIVSMAIDSGADGIAYTYTEPTIFAEYALDTMRLARKKKLYNAWVSNGYMTREVIEAVSPFLDAINIDLKGDDRFYEEMCGGIKRKFVLENIRAFHEKGVHTEVTNLIVPGYNDKPESFREIANFIHGISPDLPLHFSRFFPQYKLDYLPPTDEEKVLKAMYIAKEVGLNYVYAGNMPSGRENTECKKCGALLVKRSGYSIDASGLKKGKCAKCGSENNFVA